MLIVFVLVALLAGLVIAGSLTLSSGLGMGVVGLVVGVNAAFVFLAFVLRRRDAASTAE